MQSIVLPVLFAAVGWLFTSAIEDFSDRKILTYQIANDPDEANTTTVRLRNISPVRQNTTFVASLTCVQKERLCFQKHEVSNTSFYNQILQNPHFVNVETLAADKSFIKLKIAMPPDSEILLSNLKRYDTTDVIIFLESESPDNLVYLDGSSALAFLIAHRISIYISLSVALLLLIILFNFPNLTQKRQPQSESAEGNQGRAK